MLTQGPTAILPFSHYWTIDHEENHDGFAGTDCIDFSEYNCDVNGCVM